MIMLFKDRNEHIFSALLFAFIVFILSCVIFLSSSIKYDINSSFNDSAQIVITNQKALFPAPLNDEDIEKILFIRGVDGVDGGVDGRYHFLQANSYFKIVGDDMIDDNLVIVGRGVKDTMNSFYYKDYFNFFTCNADVVKLNIAKQFISESSILSNNLITMSSDNARKILGLEDDEYSTINVYIPNSNEVEYISQKISALFPQANVTSIDERRAKIEKLFYYKGGIFLIFYITVLLSFSILLYKQVNSISSKTKKEIGILRSLGYSIVDVIKLKILQHLIVSVSSFMFGFVLAYVYTFVLDAPLLKKIFLGSQISSNVEFTPIIDFQLFFLIFILTIVPYLGSIIIPAWKIATREMSEVLKWFQ